MLTNDKERRICEKYSAYDKTGHVHCRECPLRKGGPNDYGMCKALMHYDRHKKEWVFDDEE